jgi:hypothetical protein
MQEAVTYGNNNNSRLDSISIASDFRYSQQIQVKTDPRHKTGGILIGGFMDACKKIQFYTPGQILAAWAGIAGLAVSFLTMIILFI